MKLRDRVASNIAQTKSLSREIEDGIKEYVDEFQQVHVADSFQLMYIVVRGKKFWIHDSSSIKDLKAEGCSNSAPTTEDEFHKMLEDNVKSIRVARQAYLFYKSIT